MDPVRELKVQAEFLHKRMKAGDLASLARLRVLPEFKQADEALLSSMTAEVRRKHGLAVVAREYGFSNWEHALRVLNGDPAESDFGTLLYDKSYLAGSILNHWFADDGEARAFLVEASREGARRYLLAYRRDFLVVEAHFVKLLGMDPDDPDWRAIGWDWIRPANLIARRRLYQQRILALRRSWRGDAP
jgi:DNA-binding phage protein